MSASRDATEPARWVAVAPSTDVTTRKPVAFTLHDDEWVVWRDGAGRICAQARRCPHLDRDLVDATVVGLRLVCPGHGWSFDVDGHVVKHNERGRADPKGRVRTLPARERDDTVEIDTETLDGRADR